MSKLLIAIAKPIRIFTLIIVLGGITIFMLPATTLADAYVPTDTPIPPTPDLQPTITPEPTDEAPQTPETSGDAGFTNDLDDSLPVPGEKTTAPQTSLISTLSTSNLCLLGLAIALLVGVMVMVIYGVIQRMSA